MTRKIKLNIVLIIMVNIFEVQLIENVEIRGHINDNTSKLNSNTRSYTQQVVFKSDTPDLNHKLNQYDYPIFQETDQNIKIFEDRLKDDYTKFENVDYTDKAAGKQNNERQIIFKDQSKSLSKIVDTPKIPVKFESNNDGDEVNNEISRSITFVDNNNKAQQNESPKMKSKSRRRPKYQPHIGYPGLNSINGNSNLAPNTALPVALNYPGYPGSPSTYPGHYLNLGYPGNINLRPDSVASYPNFNQVPVSQFFGYPGYQEGSPEYVPNSGQSLGYQQSLQENYRPHRQPKSLASKALSALSEALSSIATNDDYECVPRLLCEAAGGRATGSNSFLQSITGLEPLLSVLSAYNGISTSPLFVFGRAVFLGMTSKGTAATCRYAYPQCPTDPEKLIYYLNNHKGGFFRFFNTTLPQYTQNLQQFYNQLAGQYGQYDSNKNQHNFGQENKYGLANENLYGNSQKYGTNYGYNQNKYGILDQNRYRKVNIEDRIQNKPIEVTEDAIDQNSKWLFPDEVNNENDLQYEIKPTRDSKLVKFPDENNYSVVNTKDYVRKIKGIYFPEGNNGIIRNYENTTPVNFDDYVFDYKHNFYVKRPKLEKQRMEDEEVRTVYIVRGNGDPNHPEIVKYKPQKYT